MTIDTQKLHDAAAGAINFASSDGILHQLKAKAHINGLARTAFKCCNTIDAQAAETDLLRKTLDDMAAGIPARDAEIAELRVERDGLREVAKQCWRA